MIRILNILLCALALSLEAAGAERLRLIVETDAGGDPDDEQSMVRFLLYANEWDIEGIIANREKARDGENKNKERTGVGIVKQLIHAYGECWTNLVQHDPRYPRAETLLQRTCAGYSNTDEAVNFLIRAVDAQDLRPIWYMDWGTDHGAATNNLRRALDRILKERGQDGYATFKSKLRVILSDRILPEDTQREPAWPLWINTWAPPINGRRWYHQFSAITARAGGFDIARDVLAGHGPLGALYPTNTTHWQKEGDSGSFLYLVPTGMNEPTEPRWGSWAGRYWPREDFPSKDYYWASSQDVWNGSTNRDNTLHRWAAHLQNDFKARMDWCVKPRADANHPPIVKLNGASGIVHISSQPNKPVKLDAAGSSDPDSNALSCEWIVYPEAGTCQGSAPLTLENETVAWVNIPESERGRTVHIILAITDNGEPRLTRYARAIINVELIPQ